MKLGLGRWRRSGDSHEGDGAAGPIEDGFAEIFEQRVSRAYDPLPSTLADSRARIMGAYSSAASSSTGSDRLATLPERFSRRWLSAAALALVAVVGLGGVVAAASSAGQPFYGIRLAAEALTLPPQGNASRIPSELDRLDARLAEARGAAGPNDLSAFRDALAAYLEELRSLKSEAGLDAAAARVQAVLATHVIVLTGLLTVVPAEARRWIEEALDQVDRLIARLPTSHASTPPSGGSVPTNPAVASPSPGHASPRPIPGEAVPLPSPPPSLTPSHRQEHSRGVP